MYRDEFDEEKEPDGMVLSGWHQTSLEKGDSSKTLGNGESTSKTLPSATDADKNSDSDIVASARKRKMDEGSSADDISNLVNQANSLKKPEVLDDDDDDIVMLEDGVSAATNKKKRLQ